MKYKLLKITETEVNNQAVKSLKFKYDFACLDEDKGSISLTSSKGDEFKLYDLIEVVKIGSDAE